MQFRVDRAHKELGESGHTQQEELMVSLKNKLTKFHKEKDIWEAKEATMQEEINSNEDEIAKLRRSLHDSERMRQEMNAQVETLLHELQGHRRASAAMNDSRTFREFVQVKRELAQVKEENEQLKLRIVAKVKSNSLPIIKQAQPQKASRKAASKTTKDATYLSGKEIVKR